LSPPGRQGVSAIPPGKRGTRKLKGVGFGLSIANTLVGKTGGLLVIDSTLGQGSSFSFQVAFALAALDFQKQNVALNMIPCEQDLTDAYHFERPLRFLVVDDNCLNKSLFERTVNNMFKKQKRIKPIYTFAADSTSVTFVHPLLPLKLEMISRTLSKPQVRKQSISSECRWTHRSAEQAPSHFPSIACPWTWK
jgi:hypothetical protein